MCKLSSVQNSIRLCIVLLFGNSFAVHAADLITVSQSGSVVEWQIASTSFAIDEINLVVTGPEQAGATPSGCTSPPLVCSSIYSSSGNPNFDASGFDAGTYNWQIEIIPLIDGLACESATDIREEQGGLQGLIGDVATTPEEDYLACLLNAGLIPSNEEELLASGSFNIGSDTALVVPEPQDPGTPDNIPPLAICMDVVVEGSASNCSVAVNVDDGSNDPDGTLVSIVQDPLSPYGLGITNVTLTVTDDIGATDSCDAVVTVTDSLAPDILCPANNTMTPPTAPATFTAIASDTCGIPVTQVTSYDCYRFNKKGKRIDTNDSCVVSLSNDSITVNETSGVNSLIDWTIEATDSVGNGATATCTIEVNHPNK